MLDFLYRYRLVIALAILAVAITMVVSAIEEDRFSPEGSYETVVGSGPDSHRFELRKGQTMGARFILSHSKDRGVTVQVASLHKAGQDLWERGALLEDYGRVADSETVWFEAAADGFYSLEVSSPGSERLHVMVQYCVLE